MKQFNKLFALCLLAGLVAEPALAGPGVYAKVTSEEGAAPSAVRATGPGIYAAESLTKATLSLFVQSARQ